jgi:flagellar basal body rod protein FlgG
MNISSVALSGLNKANAKLDSVARSVAAGTVDTVDLSNEAVALIQAKNEFAANIELLKTANDLNKLALKLPE